MEENMMNGEFMDVAEEVAPTTGSGIGGKILGGALLAGGIYAAYKLVKKFKAKKGSKYVESKRLEEDDVIDAEDVEELNRKLN
jgi:hypothetical protein